MEIGALNRFGSLNKANSHGVVKSCTVEWYEHQMLRINTLLQLNEKMEQLKHIQKKLTKQITLTVSTSVTSRCPMGQRRTQTAALGEPLGGNGLQTWTPPKCRLGPRMVPTARKSSEQSTASVVSPARSEKAARLHQSFRGVQNSRKRKGRLCSSSA